MKKENDIVARLCDLGGFILLRCDNTWGGTYGWMIAGKTTKVLGYKTEKAAKEGFIADATSSALGGVMLKMLKKMYDPKKDRFKSPEVPAPDGLEG